MGNQEASEIHMVFEEGDIYFYLPMCDNAHLIVRMSANKQEQMKTWGWLEYHKVEK